MMKIICASAIKVKKADIKLRGASKKTQKNVLIAGYNYIILYFKPFNSADDLKCYLCWIVSAASVLILVCYCDGDNVRGVQR